MLEKAWCTAARELATRQGSIIGPTISELRDGLVELDRLMREAPEFFEDGYRRIEEPTLSSTSEVHARSLEGDFAWPDHDDQASAAILTALATQIRAVDIALKGLSETYDRKPSRLHIRKRWLDGGGTTYVVPAPRGRDYGRDPSDRATYRRRGVLLHRLIPAEIRGLEVEFVILADRLDELEDPRLGAALLPDLVVDAPPRGDGTFLVTSATSPDIGGVIVEQVSRAHADGACLIVWPELSVDEDTLSAIAVALARRASEAQSKPPALVVAGSWHVEENGVHYNEAPVLTGKGKRIGSYRKVIVFEDREHGREAIEAGRKLVVIVAERFLATVGICKDYCDLGLNTRWRELDVDLVLVPSMGDPKTMRSHLEVAANLRLLRDQRAFVVQQYEPAGPGVPLGFVLHAGRKVPSSVTETATEESWSVHVM